MTNSQLLSRVTEILEVLPKDLLELKVQERYRDMTAPPPAWTAILECRRQLESLRVELAK